ncbi:MAG: hypothetical protein AAF497_13160, partial [Planctomycetota bacterium]
MDSDARWMQSIVLDGPEPLQIDFLPELWTTTYFNGGQQWFLPPFQTPWNGVTRLATYEPNLDLESFLCAETSSTVDSDPVSASTNYASNIVVDDQPPAAELVTAPAITEQNAPAVYEFTVTITDQSLVILDDVVEGTFEVTGPNGFQQTAALVSKTQNDDRGVDATFSINAPNGAWAIADDGRYTVSQTSLGIADLGGNVTSEGVVGSFFVAMDSTTPPSVTVVSINDALSESSVVQLIVEYSDNVAIDVSSVDSGDLQIIGANGQSLNATVTSVSSSSDTTPFAVTYEVSPPGDQWDTTDNSIYAISLVENEVRDVAGISVPAVSLGEFEVFVVRQRCETPDLPFAESMRGDFHPDFYYTPSTGRVVVDSDGTWLNSISVFGEEPDDISFLPGSWTTEYVLDSQQWMLGPSQAPWQGVSRLADYPIGLNVETELNCVETGINLTDDPLSESFGRLSNLVIDDSPPVATTTAPEFVTAQSSPDSYLFDVEYSDQGQVDFESVSDGDFVVIGPNGFSESAQLITKSASNDGQVLALYRIPAAGGMWDESDDGTYVIQRVPGEIVDLGGNESAGGIAGTFEVVINDMPPNVTVVTAPGDVLSESSTPIQIVVEYNDNIAIDASTLDNADLQVLGSNGVSLETFLVSVSPNLDVGTIRATYDIHPAGVWDAAENGSYEIRVVENEVRDTFEIGIPETFLSEFDVFVVRQKCENPSFPLAQSEKGDFHPDFYYTPDTGRFVVDSDGVWLQSLLAYGVEPESIDFLPEFWTTEYFLDSQQWFLGPLEDPWQGITQFATYATNLDVETELNCVESSISLDGNPNSQSTNRLTWVAVDDNPPVPASDGLNVPVAVTPTFHEFTVNYSDEALVVLNSVNDGDINVSGPNGYSEIAELISKSQNATGGVDAIYRISAAGGQWDEADNGTYVITSLGGAVDLGGNVLGNGVIAGTFDVIFDISAPNVS